MGFDFVKNLPRPPSKEERAKHKIRNPIALLASLTVTQYLLFLSGLVAWCCDAMDFFSVSLTVPRLEEQFDKSAHTITTSITLTLLFRSLGAAIFGTISDRYGRKWPLVVNLVIVAVLELGTGFVNDFKSFLALRSLFGVGMGGIWGLATANALENMPVEARGIFSGILQEGYAMGYLFAACANLKAVPHYDSWRVLFYIAAGLSLGAAIFRAILPESDYFIRARAEAERAGTTTANKSKNFIRSAGRAFRIHWQRCIFAVLLMSGFNFFSHGSQDLYPTFLSKQKLLPGLLPTKATIIANCGAIVGGVWAGWLSQYAGRRITIIIFCVWAALFIPLWIIPDNFSSLAAGAFCLQIGVQGAWGVIPVYLSEISPPAFRAVFPGVAYQLGNMVSSASAQIEATAGDNLKTLANDGHTIVPNYGKVQGILIGVVAAYIILCTLVGREDLGAEFEKHRAAFEEGGGDDDARIVQDVEAGKKVAHGEPTSTVQPATDEKDLPEKDGSLDEEEKKERVS